MGLGSSTPHPQPIYRFSFLHKLNIYHISDIFVKKKNQNDKNNNFTSTGNKSLAG